MSIINSFETLFGVGVLCYKREKETLKLKHHKGGKKIEALKNGVSNDGFLELARQIKRQKKINDGIILFH